jgi:precorrin-6Y C5,15-methyltransferase (decarboxylating)
MSRSRPVTVVGISDDGCAGLSSRAVGAVSAAQVLAGGERHLAFFPQFRGKRIVFNGGIMMALEHIAEAANENSVCVVASGDPMFFGVGAAVIQRLGAEHVEVLPHPSSMQLAFARVGTKWDDAAFISLHGRSRAGFLTRLRSCAKAGVLTDPQNTPARLAAAMLDCGETGWRAWVCENLTGPDERVRTFSITELADRADIGPLNVLILMREDKAWRVPPSIPFIHEDEFAKRVPKKGLITKREVRLLSLAAMRITPDSVVWDIGAGSGSVSIEAAMLAPQGRVYAIEVDPEGVEICHENLRAHAIDNVRVIAGRAPEALADLETPDAVFVGGSRGSMDELVEVALERLQPGGRLVANAITLENSGEVYASLRKRGIVPEVTLLQISRAEPLARYLRFEALNPIQVFAAEKPASGGASR